MQPKPDNLKILTYNIHKGFTFGNREFVLHEIREAIRTTRADLVFLQEIQGAHHAKKKQIQTWPDAAQFEFLADQIWQHYAYGKNAIYEQGHHGNAILSRYPFIAWKNINFSTFPTASRSILHGIIDLQDHRGHLHVICIHLDLIPFERKRQLKLLTQYIQTQIPATAPIILAGDFNDWSGRAAHRLSKLGLREIFQTLHGQHAKTFPAQWPLLKVDRIYYRNLIPFTCTTHHHKPWNRLSDHIPLSAEFEIHAHANSTASLRSAP